MVLAGNYDLFKLQYRCSTQRTPYVKKIRMAGGRFKGNHKRTSEQDITFERELKALILEEKNSPGEA